MRPGFTMELDPHDAPVKQALLRACDEVGLPHAYRLAVAQRLRTPRAEWPECCGEGCFPCTQALSDAALRAAELLGLPPPGD